MMRPCPRSRMALAAAWVKTRTARHSTSKSASSSAISVSRKPCPSPKPALLTSTSTGRSKSATRSATRAKSRAHAQISGQHLHPDPVCRSQPPRRRLQSRCAGVARRPGRGLGYRGRMRIATWNVNSIRSRIERVIPWLERSDVDVLAIQETKTREDQFPFFRFEELGYEVAHHGCNQWNGVAIASRVGLTDVVAGFADAPLWGEATSAEARHLGATCGGIRVNSLYVPNGRNILDPHMDYKIDWLGRLRDAAQGWLADGPSVLMGDWNIAPRDEDVWSMEFYIDKSHVSPRERAAFAAILDAGYVDLVRPLLPGPKVYTYWDYQQLRFQKGRGMRIDFVLGSPDVAARVTGAVIDREERKGKGASDHAPVIVELTDA